MKLEGIHHVTAITGDAQRNVDFYAGLLGLRLVKKSINQDRTSVYHLFYADEKGDPGSDITFFEYPGMPAGRAGAGMVHRIVWRVAGEPALEFWSERLARAGYDSSRTPDSLIFSDFEGLEHELAVVQTEDEPLTAEHPEIPAELALQGFEAVRAFAADPALSDGLLNGNAWIPSARRRQLRSPRATPRRPVRVRHLRASAGPRGRHGAPRRMGLPARGP